MPNWVPYNVRLVLGFAFLAVTLPLIGMLSVGAVVWYYADPITMRIAAKLTALLKPWSQKFTRKPEDAFLVPFLFMQGVVVPALFFYNLWYTMNYGLSFTRVYLYHLLRVGPYFQSFAYAYTLCHKEGHTRVGMFKNEYQPFVGNAWNWWIGVFYGVMPSTFAYGHTVNHHRYDNDEEDTVTTWDQPRDNFLHWVAFLPRWLAYHFNISVFIQFMVEGDKALAIKMVWGTGSFLAAFTVLYKLSPVFCFFYFAYPILEASLLLSAINWAWHCFVDPDADNVYAYSVTIFNGFPYSNILNEDYHVVHHQYPGAHWTEHPRLFEKHKEEYVSNQATIFDGMHAIEIFFVAVFRQYHIFAEKFVDLSNTLTMEQKEQLIKTRLRTCTWGVNANTIQAKAKAAASSSASASKKEK